MTTPAISDYLKYANLQMAAEAFLKIEVTGEEKYAGEKLINALVAGNDHASKFIEAAAADFADHWIALDQESNTGTGFSGTLFKCVRDDPTTGAKVGELVLSFRSTEFIDDHARDNEATNTLEISEYGYAFGQIADMENWYQRLHTDGLLPQGSRYSVTGYSLGGHLATAFHVLRHEDNSAGRIDKVVTFNGAGIGTVDPTVKLTTLINKFQTRRDSPDGSAHAFADPDLAKLYARIKTASDAGEPVAAADRRALQAFITPPKGSTVDNLTHQQALNISIALGRIDKIHSEVGYLAKLTNNGSGCAKPLAVTRGRSHSPDAGKKEGSTKPTSPSRQLRLANSLLRRRVSMRAVQGAHAGARLASFRLAHSLHRPCPGVRDWRATLKAKADPCESRRWRDGDGEFAKHRIAPSAGCAAMQSRTRLLHCDRTLDVANAARWRAAT
ncbi:MAG: hypothetical protein IPH08_03450 [Rhodocyclaceae bacterium]|nr:hypothetical protein [Rhodocyclaceae bacterium]